MTCVLSLCLWVILHLSVQWKVMCDHCPSLSHGARGNSLGWEGPHIENSSWDMKIALHPHQAFLAGLTEIVQHLRREKKVAGLIKGGERCNSSTHQPCSVSRKSEQELEVCSRLLPIEFSCSCHSLSCAVADIVRGAESVSQIDCHCVSCPLNVSTLFTDALAEPKLTSITGLLGLFYLSGSFQKIV